MKKFLSAALALCLAFSLAACGGSGSSTPASTAPSGGTAGSGAAIKIGGIGPVTGSTAVYGNAVKNGAEIAIAEINALGGQQYEMKFEDDENDAEKAINAYNSLKDWGMQILMGTVTSNPCIAVAAETANDNMFQLTPSGSAEGCIANDNAFRVCFSDPEQGTLSADYIVENSLAAKVAVIYDSSDPYSSGIHDAFVTEAQEKGLEIVSDEAFTADSNKDFTVQIQKAQSAGAELVFLPIYYTEASLILTQADKIGYEPVFFGCDGLDGLVSVENFDTSLAEDVMLMTPFTASATDDKTAAFVKAYNEAYGEDPNQFAADAYDAIYAIHAAVEKAGVTADMDASAICDALKAAFTEITLEGLTGKGITWDASGAPAKSPLVYIIKDGVYTAAPRLVPHARKLDEVTYNEMLELATLGAQVLHNRSVEMAKKYNVSLEVLSSFSGNPGTKVKEVAKRMEKSYISSVAKDTNIARIALLGVPNEIGTSFKVFSLLAQHNINVDIILQGIGHEEGKDICFTVAQSDLAMAEKLLRENQERIRFRVLETNADVAKVSVVGAGVIGNPGVAAKLFEALYDAGININMISTSEIKISVLVERRDAEKAVQVIHDKFFAI